MVKTLLKEQLILFTSDISNIRVSFLYEKRKKKKKKRKEEKFRYLRKKGKGLINKKETKNENKL